MTGLLEREREVAAIRDGIDSAVRGDGRCVVLEGPAGIGKSALMAGAREEARAGLTVLHGLGGVLEVDFPYGVVRQLFEPLAGRAELFSGAAELARPVLSIRGAQEPGGDTAALEALHGLYWLTANLAAETPLLIAVDDAHWCDGASLRFLVYLRRRLEGLRVLLLVAARPGEAGANQELLDLLAGEVVRPAELSRQAVRTLLAARLGEDPAPPFVAAAHAATQGNPFLMRELVTALVDAGVRPVADAVDSMRAIGPHGVSRAILRRLAGLGPGATALARAVAVLGGDAELRHAAALAELSEEEAARVVAALVRTEILRDERRLSFVHPLVRAAIYADVPAPARSQAHRRAARILAEAGAGDDAVAAHLIETTPAGDAGVVEHLRAAAGKAAAQGAMDVAARYLRRAIEEPPDPGQRADVLRELGTAELAAGRPDAAADRLAAALAEARDVEAKISIGLMRRHALVLADRIGEAVEALDAVRREVLPDADDLLESGAIGAGHLDFDVVRADLLEAGTIGAGQAHMRVAPSVLERLERLRGRAADPALREPLTLAVAAFATASSCASLEEANSLIDRAIACLPDAHPQSDYTVEGQLVVATMLCDRFDEFRELTTTWLDDARRTGSIPRFISMATMRAHYHYRVGELEEAKSDARDALEAAALYGHHFWVPGSAGALINPLVDQGRLEEAERVLVDSRVQERHGHSSSAPWATMLLPARGRLRVAQERTEEGLQDLLACGERYESAANRSPSMWPWRSEAALALVALGEHDRARVLARQELEVARGFGAPRPLGMALRAAGIVDGSVELLQEAVTVLAGSPARLERARALVDLGAALRRAGRRTEARRHLRDGLELALRCGADALAERAREELLASGAQLRRERLRGPEALTPSELRVARMAADGRSNPEIAQALFLTRRTVETHLTHAYQKLGIDSRRELTAALHD